MEIKCDLDKTREIVKNINLNVERYNEIVKDFYDVVRTFNAHGWTGAAAANYSNYLEGKKRDFDTIYASLRTFSEQVSKNVTEYENAISTSKVSGND